MIYENAKMKRQWRHNRWSDCAQIWCVTSEDMYQSRHIKIFQTLQNLKITSYWSGIQTHLRKTDGQTAGILPNGIE